MIIKQALSELAHKVVYNGVVHSMAVACVYVGADGLWHVEIVPFECETEGTSFHSGTLYITGAEGAETAPEVLFS